MQGTLKKERVFTTSTLVKLAILSAIGYILMFISIPIPMLFPAFLKIDVSDLTALLGGIALGPTAGVIIAFMKNLLQFITGASSTGGVGELANFVIGGAFVWTVAYVYTKKKDLKGLVIGLILGIIVMTIVGCISNYFIMLPFYSTMMPIEDVINMGAAINPIIVDKLTFVIWIIGPFNILKAGIMSLLTLPLYKKTAKLLNKSK